MGTVADGLSVEGRRRLIAALEAWLDAQDGVPSAGLDARRRLWVAVHQQGIPEVVRRRLYGVLEALWEERPLPAEVAQWAVRWVVEGNGPEVPPEGMPPVGPVEPPHRPIVEEVVQRLGNGAEPRRRPWTTGFIVRTDPSAHRMELLDADSFEVRVVELEPSWHYFVQAAWEGALVYAFNLVETTGGIFRADDRALLVLEPDYVFDVTTLCRSLLWKGAHGRPLPEMYLLDKVRPPTLSEAMVRGGLLGAYVEIRTAHPALDHSDAWSRAVFGRMMDILQVADAERLAEWEVEARRFWVRQQEVLRRLGADDAEVQTEVSFLLPWLGVRGRVDVWIRRPERWDVVEIKAKARPPANGYVIPEHAAQAYLYQLMLSTLADRPPVVATHVAYLADAERPLREVLTDEAHFLRALMRIRNHAVGYEFWMAFRGAALPRILEAKANALIRTDLPHWLRRDWAEALDRLGRLTDDERDYVAELHSFMAREQWYAIIGTTHTRSEDRRCYAGLWRPSVTDDPFQRMTGLRLDPEASDPEGGLLVFHHSADTYFSGREGDVVVVMPDDDRWARSFRALSLYTGVIVRREADRLVVRMRDAGGARRMKDEAAQQWVLALETYISGYHRLVAGLARFLDAPSALRSLWLGRRPPRKGQASAPNPPDLTPHQQRLLQAALSAADYYLLQGPPGTGKTRYMLRSIVAEAHTQHRKVLLLGYTNRAVDEICGVLRNHLPKVRFLRLGSPESTEWPEATTAQWHADHPADVAAWQRRMAGVDCVVATIHAVGRVPRLAELFPYDVVVADEASQLLDAYAVGVLAGRTAPFVMIGDERQLPAVTVQPDDEAAVRSERLRALGFTTWSESMFGRLLRRCEAEGWHHAHGMLVEQGRMHVDIQEVAGRLFYDGKLRPVDPVRQSAPFIPPSPTMFERRVVFVDVPSEGAEKENPAEVRRVAEVVRWLREMGIDESEIGVIAPFRAQVASIVRTLRDTLHLRDILVDTVERFQGAERRAVVISTTVATPDMLAMIASRPPNAPHIDRKLNVMLTRAKEFLVVVGNRRILEQDAVYAGMLRHIASLPA